MAEEKQNPQKKEPKKVVSQILAEKRQWIDARLSKPEPGQLVVIRIMNPTILYAETETEIYPSEDAKIGRFVRDYNDPNKGEWHVNPPFPLYDYSPLTTKDRLNDFSIVTHWAIPEEGEVEGWNTRFDQINLFKKLNIEVDEEHEEDVYRALIYGAAYMQKGAPDDPDVQHLATILYDLQYVMDNHKAIDLTDDEYLEMVKKRAEEVAEEEAKKKAEQEKNEVVVNRVSEDGEPEDKGDE